MEVSPALAAAQRRLFALRAELNKKTAKQPNGSGGWLDALKARVNGAAERVETTPVEPILIKEECEEKEAAAPAAFLAIVPDVAVAMLREERAAAGRIWWLLRGIDVTGQGAVKTAQARAQLATKGAAWRVCGWRQLRNLLGAGEGVFWERRNGTIWLRSLAKVAASLGVERVSAEAVRVPVADLLGTMGAVRATLYAAFHGGRGEHGGPIARQRLREVCGVCERSQIAYEQRRGVRSTPQFAVLPNDVEAAAWRHGRAIFQIEDVRGKYGPAGAQVLVRQLPNRYTAKYAVSGRRKRRLNRQLTDLLNMGTAGNGYSRFERMFWTDGAAAVKMGGDRFVNDGGKWWFTV